jgi:ABC-type proline/glycine betaine transport system permease subunit
MGKPLVLRDIKWKGLLVSVAKGLTTRPLIKLFLTTVPVTNLGSSGALLQYLLVAQISQIKLDFCRVLDCVPEEVTEAFCSSA